MLTALVKLFSELQYLGGQTGTDADATSGGLTEIDYEEQSAGYQAAYSRLAASESGPVDPVAYVGDVRAFLGRALARVDKGVLVGLVRGCEGEGVGAFLEGLMREGYLVV